MNQAKRVVAPDPLKPIPFNIPQPTVSTLDNGLKIVVFPNKRLPLVSYRLAFLSGDAHEGNERIGMTSAMAAMLTEGTANYSSRELAEKVERLGASLSASSSEDFTIISASALSIYSSEILELLAEIVFRPAFPESELDLYKRNAIENLKFQRSQPNFLANEQTARILYGDHPYSIISPTPEHVEKFSREHLIQIHAERLAPNKAVLVAVGDVEESDLLPAVKDLFAAWQPREDDANSFPDPPERSARTLTIVDRPGSAQSNIVLANLALERRNPDFFAATVMNQILGAGASSRVFMNLREEKGYTYGAYTRLDAKRTAGDFEATAEVRTSVTGDSLREFFYELERIRNERVSDDELRDAKNFLTGVFPIRAETQEGLTNLLVSQQLYELPDDYLQTYRENIESVTADDVLLAAQKYVHPDVVSIVIVGDASEVLAQARTYAENIEIYDTNRNRMDISSFEMDSDAKAEDASGRWSLSLDFQGQSVPVTLTLTQSDSRVTGTIETALGNGEIKDGSVRGNRLSATASTEIQGQSVDFVINGSIDGDSMKGTLSTAIIPDELSFEGKREA